MAGLVAWLCSFVRFICTRVLCRPNFSSPTNLAKPLIHDTVQNFIYLQNFLYVPTYIYVHTCSSFIGLRVLYFCIPNYLYVKMFLLYSFRLRDVRSMEAGVTFTTTVAGNFQKFPVMENSVFTCLSSITK